MIALFLWTTTSPGIAAPPDHKSDSSSRADRFDLLFFAPDHPVIIRLQVRIGDAGITTFRRRYTAQLFRTLDKKRDGFLTRSEVTAVERLGEIASRFRSLPRTWKDFDTDPDDNRLSLPEFTAVVAGALGAPFDINMQSRTASRSAELFNRLDANHDGLLVASEVFNGAKRLRRLDLDDDETFSTTELDPLQYETAQRESRPLVALATADHKVLAERITARYGQAGTSVTSTDRTGNRSTSARNPSVALKDLRLPADQVIRFDRDGNERLDRRELVALLGSPIPHETINASLPDPKSRRTQLSVVNGPATRGFTRLTRPWGGWNVQLRAKSARSDRILTTKFYRLRFHVADSNKNKYVEPAEFPQLQLSGASFAMVDGNNDGKVLLAELTDFIKDQTAVQQSRLLLGVTHSSKSLLEILDADGDQRLSPREFREGYPRLRRIDKDGDGRISRTDLSGDYLLTLEVARAALFTSEAMAMPRPVNPASSTVTANRRGPAWFQKMDRNGDGDVSEREFLGDLKLFSTLDRNRDGLLSVEETKVLEPNK